MARWTKGPSWSSLTTQWSSTRAWVRTVRPMVTKVLRDPWSRDSLPPLLGSACWLYSFSCAHMVTGIWLCAQSSHNEETFSVSRVAFNNFYILRKDPDLSRFGSPTLPWTDHCKEEILWLAENGLLAHPWKSRGFSYQRSQEQVAWRESIPISVFCKDSPIICGCA